MSTKNKGSKPIVIRRPKTTIRIDKSYRPVSQGTTAKPPQGGTGTTAKPSGGSGSSGGSSGGS